MVLPESNNYHSEVQLAVLGALHQTNLENTAPGMRP